MNPLDMTAINNLRDLQKKIGKNLLQELIKIYLEGTPQMLQNMRIYLNSQAFEDLAREAHSLKSSSANLGAKQVQEHAKAIEYYIVKDGKTDPSELAGMIGRVESAFREAQAALANLG